MKFFTKNKVEQQKIECIDAYFTYITNIHSKLYSCKLINSKHKKRIAIITDKPLFKNDHILIEYTYNDIKFKYEAIVSDVVQSENIIRFLEFSEYEQHSLDSLIAASFRKRF